LEAQPGAAAALDAGAALDAASLLEDGVASLLDELATSLDEEIAAAVVDEVGGVVAAVCSFLSPPHAPRLASSTPATAIEVLRQAGLVRWMRRPVTTVVPS
jgi:hypothetical protein